MLKKLTILLVCFSIAILPILNCDFSYADDDNSTWLNIENETGLSAAMKAYAKAQDRVTTRYAFFHYNDPIESLITKMSYTYYSKAAKLAGINLNDLQNSIKYRVNNDGVLEFLYNASWISSYNKLIEYYLIENGLDPDGEFDTLVYSGEIFIDDDYNQCYVFTGNFQNTSGFTNVNIDSQWDSYPGPIQAPYISSIGSPYVFGTKGLIEYYSGGLNTQYTYHINNNDYVMNLAQRPNYATGQGGNIYSAFGLTNAIWYYEYNEQIMGYPIIFKNNINLIHYPDTGKPTYSLGIFNVNYADLENVKYSYYAKYQISDLGSGLFDAAINIAKSAGDAGKMEAGKMAAIKIGQYGADAAIAAANYLADQDDDDPVVDPDVQDGVPNYPTPTPSATNIGINQDPNGNFNFTMPDLNIDWNLDLDINDLPFPFSIPNDLYHAFNALNVDPEPPRFQGTVDLVIYEWPVDIDFSDFNGLANTIRKWILFVYIVTLIVATRSVMHIY